MRRLFAIAIMLLAAAPLRAQESTSEFYRGKTLRIINPFAETGIYAAMTRALVEVMPRHIHPDLKARGEAMPGAGGLQGANYVYNSAPRDGTAIAILYDNMPTLQALALDNSVRFDARRFTTLGTLNRGETGVVAILKRAGVPSVAIARERVAALGATGAGAAQYIVPLAMNRMLGTRFNLLPSYRAVESVYHSMDAGELDGLFTNYSTIEDARPNWIEQNQLDLLAQSADARDPDFPDVPLLQDLTDDPLKQQAFTFLAMSRVPGKIIYAPPEVPKDRTALLEDALMKTLRDPAFARLMAGVTRKIEPRDGVEAMDIIRRTVDVDSRVLENVRELMGAK